jgi:KUP system potassium uptake protein
MEGNALDAQARYALWRERLFVFLRHNSRRASSFFHIPAEQVVEIGVVVEI